MAVALEHAEVDAPWAYGVTILAGHDSGDLVQVGEVMGGPCGKELRERYWAEGWMLSWQGEILGLQS